MPIRTLAQVTPTQVDWLWPGWLARGKVTLLDGDPGLGKSWIALDACARVSSGRAWPDGAANAGPAPALFLSAEDNDADTLAPRLHALGADPERMHVWPSEQSLPRLPGQLEVLEQVIAQSEARLVVLDPLLAFLTPGVAVQNDVVRDLLTKLSEIACAKGCAILLLRHLIKRQVASPLYRGAGAMAFAAASRLAWLALIDPHDASRRLLAVSKNNLAPAPSTQAYRLADEPGGGPRLQWLGPVAWRPHDPVRLPAGAGRAGATRVHERAERWLRNFLKQGPCLSRDLWRAARRRSIGRNTLLLAKEKLAVTIRRIPYKGEILVLWLLPGQQLPEFLRPGRPSDGSPG